MTGDELSEGMKRRSLLATTGAGLLSALGGCSSSSAEEEEPRAEPEFQETTPEWRGGRHSTNSYGAKVRYGDYFIGPVGVSPNIQVGVYEGPEVEDQEAIPDDEFTWYRADEGNYLWLVGVEAEYASKDRRGTKGDIHTEIAADEWAAAPITQTSSIARDGDDDKKDMTPTHPLSATDVDPTYFREPMTSGGKDTRHAYHTDGGRMDTPEMLFEVDGRGIEISLGNPSQGEWYYEVTWT